MTTEQSSAKRPGRNDPCPCGSGRKYKDCHRKIEEAERSEQMRLRQAQDTLLPKIIEAARSLPAEFPTAFERFWEGKYTPEQMDALDELEDMGAQRFLTWFAFDYRPTGTTGNSTLVEQLNAAADSGGFELEAPERTLIERWRTVRLRPYQLIEVRKGKRIMLRDLLNGGEYHLSDYHASKRLLENEVLVGHLVPADTAPGATAPTYYLAGAAAQLTDDTAEKLVEYAELHLADMRRSHPTATWDDLINERSQILNHFVSALPREERDPTMVDTIVMQSRVALQLTGESIAQLLGREPPRSAAPTEAAALPAVADAPLLVAKARPTRVFGQRRSPVRLHRARK